MLEYVNLLMIIIILTVLIIDSVFIIKLRKRVNELDSKIVNDNSLLDLSEFNNLDAEFKKRYKNYVLKGIMPPVVNAINTEIQKNNIHQELEKNKTEINEFIKVFTNELNTNIMAGSPVELPTASPAAPSTTPSPQTNVITIAA